METWGTRLRDFEEWRLPDMDAHGVTVQVLSLTAPGIQAVPDAPTAIANAKIANDYLATIVTLKRPMWESDSEASNLILFQSLMLLFWPGAQ
jgi:predicted TIM-barrel fold metal-dependent hydrolase